MHHFTRSLLALSFAVSLAAGDRLYTVTSNDATLRLVNPFTGTTISSVPITSSAGQVNWANGLAVHPLTGDLWAILNVSGSGRVLARLDPTTGIATVVGPTGRAFAGIAFAANGTLYGVTGDGDQVAPETLFTLNLQTGAPTQVLALGNGDDGETIGFDPVTGNLLHASGYFSPVLERIDLGSLTVTSMPTSGSPYIEALAITHWVGSNFLMSDINDDLFVVSADGVVSKIATLDHSFIKGLAFVQTTNAAFFQPYGDGCPSNGYIPVLAGVGSPAPNSTVTLNVANGPGAAPGGLAIGFGTGAFPLRPGCVVQILPLANVVLPVVLGGSGAGTGTASVPLQIPGSVQGDLYFQAALFDGVDIVVSNPEQVHIQ